jgi:hypothetical protein
VRLVLKTRASAQLEAARELRLRVGRRLDSLGVALPPLDRVVLDGLRGKDGIQAQGGRRTPPAEGTGSAKPERK